MANQYVASPPPVSPRGGLFSRNSSSTPAPTKVAIELKIEMQRRYDLSMASKRLCTVASSSRGTADSAGASGSGSATQTAVPGGVGGSGGARVAAHSQAATGLEKGCYETPFERRTHRSLGDDKDVTPPQMSAAEAARVTNGFMANGRVNDVVKALEAALFAMDAEIEGVEKDGARTFRSSFKVSAVIPPVDAIGGGPVAMVAMVFRVTRDGKESVGKGADEGGFGETADLVVVLRRKGGDYHRYHKVEDSLISSLTTTQDS